MTREKLYDELYNQLVEEQKKLSLCQWCKINGKMTCLRDKTHVQNGCCGGCNHFSNGCKVKSLMCKMWMCKEIFAKNKGKKEFQKYLILLEDINKRIQDNEIPLVFRGSKRETFSNKKIKRVVVRKLWWYIDRVTTKECLQEGEK